MHKTFSWLPTLIPNANKDFIVRTFFFLLGNIFVEVLSFSVCSIFGVYIKVMEMKKKIHISVESKYFV